MRTKLEVCVDSLDSVRNAVNGQADRLELCSALQVGGLTPTCAFLRMVKKELNDVPVFCMIRPRGGPVVYSVKEKQLMLAEAEDLIRAGADGLVFGALTHDMNIDVSFCKEMLKVAGDIPCTFHRAFDQVNHPNEAVSAVIELGFQRLLTSGCRPTAQEGAPCIRELVESSQGRIVIMAGAGISSSNCCSVVEATGAHEIHGSFRKKMPSSYKVDIVMGSQDDDCQYITSEEEVAATVRNLREYHSTKPGGRT